MSSLTRQDREELIRRGEGWKLADPKRLLFPIVDAADITRLPALLAHHPSKSEQEKQEIKRRGIFAALRQGFNLPPSLQKELAKMNRVEMRDDPIDELAYIARLVAELRQEEKAAQMSDETAELDAARREAEAYADMVNGKKLAQAAPVQGEAEATRAAEEFAEHWNRRHGQRR